MPSTPRSTVLACALLALAACATAPPPPVARDIDFKAELARKGEWIVVAPYGRVWHPNTDLVGADFVPYLTGGGWVYGDAGWTFESKWAWGKFIFHYGRWFIADDLGWLWLPDQTWGPAWVQWRAGDGHVGWSPLPPDVRGPRTQPNAWTWAKLKHLSARDAEKFRLKPDDAARVQPRTEPLPANGPDLEVARAAGGLERDPVVVEAPPPPVVEAPPPEAAPPEAAPEPPPPPKKKGKPPKKPKRR